MKKTLAFLLVGYLGLVIGSGTLGYIKIERSRLEEEHLLIWHCEKYIYVKEGKTLSCGEIFDLGF